MAAYAALVSLEHTIDDLQRHPHPPISLHEEQVHLLTAKLTFLQKFLEDYNPQLGYSSLADPLESRIADAAYAAEDAIDSRIVDNGGNISSKGLYNPQLGYSYIEDLLESRIVDAAYAAEDAIDSHIVDNGGNISSKGLYYPQLGYSYIEDLLESRIVDAAYATEDAIDSSSEGLYQALEKVIEEMASLEKEIEGSVRVQSQLHRSWTPTDSLGSSSSSSSSIAQKSSMVGADKLLLQMKDKLVSYCGDLQIIPIVGMSGAGKTTLAINIYQDSLINEHFDICAWATISQEYSIKEILIQVLKQPHENVDKLKDNELGEMLHKHLYDRRYLIILDDMWNIQAWEGVRRFLPNNKNRSRVVITTRLSNLASEITNSYRLEMKLLDEFYSWDLLSKIVFGKKGCPSELEEIGKKIGKNCKGLPLSIVVVGGILVKSKQTREFWEYIKDNLNEIVNSQDDERCLKILHMSYKQLPVYLKPCFLYMGVFAEDKEICVSRLIKLWVAEGFLKSVTEKSLEELARVYLNELIDRNLVLIHKLGSTGTVKQCKVHDLLRDLCLKEAEKERFYGVIGRPPTTQGIVNGQRRIVTSSSALSSVSVARSLMWYHPYANQPPLNFRLLRVFYPGIFRQHHEDENFRDNIRQSVNSRFLAFFPDVYMFPSSIWLFWNLQTLIVHNSFTVSAPTALRGWYMPHIRHLDFKILLLPDPVNGQDDLIVWGNLQTLGTIKNFKCSEQVVKRIPNIKKLKIYYEECDDDGRYCLNNLDCLNKLESLECRNFPGIINFPHSLKKLSLGMESRCWQDILDEIGALPLLQKLTLRSGSFKEGQWETTEGQFRSLKFLCLRYCKGLQVWTTESSHFPCLERLHLLWIDELEEIPLDFAEIATLREIKVTRCQPSVIDSAKRILEYQEQLWGDIQVYVKVLQKPTELESSSTPNLRYLPCYYI